MLKRTNGPFASLLAAFAATLMPIQAIADDWSGPAGGTSRWRTSAERSGATFSEKTWTFALPRGVATVSSAAVADDRVVFGALDGTVRALRASDGKLLWEHELEDGVYASPAVSRGRVFVPALDKTLHALRLADGATAWTKSLGGLAMGSPTVVGDAVIVAAGFPERTILKLDAATGKTLWATRPGTLAQFSNSTVAVADGLVIVGANGGHYYGLDLGTGALRWRYEADGIVNLSAPLIVGRRVYMLPGGSSDRLHGVDLATGRPLAGWPVALATPEADADGKSLSRQISVSSLTEAGGRLIFDLRRDDSLDTDGDGLKDRYLLRELVFAVDLATGQVLWRAPNGQAVVSDPNDIPKFWLCATPAAYETVDRSLVLVTSSTLTPAIRVLDAGTGAERWAGPLDAPAQASPAFANGQLVVSTRAGVQGFSSGVNHPPATTALALTPGQRFNSLSPVLSWPPSIDPDGDEVGYVLRIARDGDALRRPGGELFVPAGQTSLRTPAPLEPGTTYVAAIRAKDAWGALSTWSDAKTFTTPAAPTVLVDGHATATLEEALNHAVAGTTVEIGPGILRLAGPSRVHAGVTLRGASAGTTLLDAAGADVALVIEGSEGAPRVRISGVTVGNARVGISVEAGGDAELQNVIVRDNTDVGVDVGAYGRAALVNATLVRNGAAVRAAGSARVKNSIVTGNRLAFARLDGGAIESRYNDLFANGPGEPATTAGPEDMNGAVVFADAANDDFHLPGPQASTDRGDPADAVGDEPAPHGGRINLGAFGGTAEAERSGPPSVAVASGLPLAPAPSSDDKAPRVPAAGCSVAADGARGRWTALFLLAAGALARRKRRGRLGLSSLLGLTALAFAGTAHAATVIWGGGTGTWGAASNWIGGAAPGAGDTASFTGWAPLDRSAWTVTTSVGTGASSTKDGSWSTRWTTGTNAAVGQWYRIDLGATRTFSQVVLDDTGDGTDYPPGFDLYVSNDGSTWGSAVASGAGTAPVTTISFANQTARYIKIQLNAAGTHWWSIRETFVYASAGTDDTQLARNGWTASASLNTGAAALAIDSAPSTRWDSGANAAPGQWFKVDLGAPTSVDRVDFSSYTSENDFPPSYTITLSTDDVNYGAAVASGSPTAAFVSATFTAATARYIKITCTGSSAYYFSIHDLNVYGTPRTASVASSISIGGITLAKGAITQGSNAAVTLSGAFTQSGGTFTGGSAAMTVASFALSGGTFTSTSGTLTVDGAFAQTGGAFSSATGAVNCSSSASVATIGAAYTVGSGSHTFAGGLTVGGSGTLTLATSGGRVAIGSAKTLTVDGTLNASSATAVIQSAGGAGTYYAFKVGSTSSARPTLDIRALAVKNTDSNGMWINAHTSAVTKFTRFDNISFSAGTGTQLLQIYATSLYLSSTGCSFDGGAAAGTTTYNVTLRGNGTSDGDTRATFGNATCATNRTPCASYKSDDDAGTGAAAHPSSDGAVAQFVTSAATDTAGTIIGFPTAAFDWNTFTYYSTYVAFHNANGTADRVYVRDSSGAARYHWEATAGEAIVGTPRWDTVGNVHYLYVATASGKVYRLIDDTSGSSLAADPAAPWNGSFFNCGCTITTPLTIDTNNIYWAGTLGGVPKLWTLGKTTRAQPSGSPLNTSASVGSAAPTIWTSDNSYVFLGMPGRISKVDVTNQSNVGDNTNPGGSTSVNGRITIMSGTLFFGDGNGYLWALDPGDNFAASSGTYKRWSYHDAANHSTCGGVCGIQSVYRDPGLARVYYGDQDGHVYVVDDAGSPVTGFPFRPGTSGDAFATSAIYMSGVIVIGTTTGTLYIIDQSSNGAGPALIKTYKFGASTQISGIAFDSVTGNYLVATSDPTAKDGKLYYISAVADPTPGYL